jgi:hypothetical protein
MSANSNTQTASTDSELNVLVAALGLTGNSRYVKDLEALADKAENAVQSIAGMNGRRVDNVVVRENFQLEQLLEERLDEDALPDVQYEAIDFRRMLDDEPEAYDNGDKEVQGVKLSAAEKAGEDGDVSEFGDDAPIAEIVAASEPDEETVEEMIEALDTVDDDFDASEDEFSIREDFDLRIREHRAAIPMSETVSVADDEYDPEAAVLTQERINRAKAKARAKTDERLYNDWFDDVPTVDAAVFIHDGSDRGMSAIENARGNNDWVKFPSQCEGTVLEISANQEGDAIVDWERYLLETGDLEAEDLTDEQVEMLQELHSEDDLEYMGVDVETASTETPEQPPAAAEGVQPASAD